ncbi:MAG: hypothetical protein MJ252_10290 [archaeon]|nr:hypothetical protein [archaeon]
MADQNATEMTNLKQSQAQPAVEENPQGMEEDKPQEEEIQKTDAQMAESQEATKTKEGNETLDKDNRGKENAGIMGKELIMQQIRKANEDVRKKEEAHSRLAVADSILSILLLIFFIAMLYMQFEMNKLYHSQRVLQRFFGFEKQKVYTTKEKAFKHIKCIMLKLTQKLNPSLNPECYNDPDFPNFTKVNAEISDDGYLTIEDHNFQLISSIRLTQRMVKSTKENKNRKHRTALILSNENEQPLWENQDGIKKYTKFDARKEESNDVVKDIDFGDEKDEKTFLAKGGFYWLYNAFDSNSQSEENMKKMENFFNYAFLGRNTTSLTLDMIFYQPENSYYANVLVSNEVDVLGVTKLYYQLHYIDNRTLNEGWGYFTFICESAYYLFLIVYLIFFICAAFYRAHNIPLFGRIDEKSCCKITFGNVFSLSQLFAFIFAFVCLGIHVAFNIEKLKDFKEFEDTVDKLLMQGDVDSNLKNQNKFIRLGMLNEVYKNFLIITIVFTCVILDKVFNRIFVISRVFLQAINKAMGDIFSFTIILIIFLLGSTVFTWLYYGDHFEEFQNFTNSIETNFELFFGIINFDLIKQMYMRTKTMTVFFYIIQVFIIRFIFMKLFLSIMIYYFNYSSSNYAFRKKSSILEETYKTRILMGWAVFVNYMSSVVCCCCTPQQIRTRKREYNPNTGRVEEKKIRHSFLKLFEDSFEKWKLENIYCPEIGINKTIREKKEEECKQADKRKKERSHENEEPSYKVSKYVYMDFDMDYMMYKKNPYFKSESDIEKNKEFIEIKMGSKCWECVVYLIFVIIFIIMYVLNVRTPWNYKTFSQIGERVSSERNKIEITSMKQFLEFDKRFLSDTFFQKDEELFKLFDKSQILGNCALFTARLIELEDGGQRKLEELDIHSLAFEDKRYLSDINLIWEKEHTFRKLGGYYKVIDLSRQEQTFDEITKNALINNQTAFIHLETFAMNEDYETIIYLEFRIKKDHSNSYDVNFRTNFLKYTDTKPGIEVAKYIFNLLFLIMIFYLFCKFFYTLFQSISYYNQWYKDVIAPLSMDLKIKRNDVEPEFLREICKLLFNTRKLLDLTVIGLGAGVLVCRLLFILSERDLRTKRFNGTKLLDILKGKNIASIYEYGNEEMGNYNWFVKNSDMRYMYELRDIIYRGINARENFQSIGSVLLFIIAIRVFSMFNLGTDLSLLNNTLNNAKNGFLTFLILLVLFFPSFVFLTYIAFGSNIKNYSTIGETIISCLKCFFGYVKHLELYSYHEAYGPLFLFLYVYITQVFFVNLFISIIYQSYTAAKPMIKAYTDMKLKYSNIICCCMARYRRSSQKLLLMKELEYKKKMTKYPSQMVIEGDQMNKDEFFLNEINQIKLLNDELNGLTKKKTEISAKYFSEKKQSIFDECSYSDINQNTYYAFKTQYLNSLMIIDEQIQNDLIQLVYADKLLEDYKSRVDFEEVNKRIDDIKDDIEEKTNELDKAYKEIEEDLHQVMGKIEEMGAAEEK